MRAFDYNNRATVSISAYRRHFRVRCPFGDYRKEPAFSIIAALALASVLAACDATLHYAESPAPVTSDDFNTLKRAAEQGDAEAQFNLGFMYAFGKGVEKNDVEAVKWFRKAAEQGDAEAQYNLGNAYAYGVRVEEDDVEAVKWYRKAAKQGLAAAQYKLGLAYAYGEGVPENNVQAYAWFSIAAALGSDKAKELKEYIAKKLTKVQIGEAQNLATEYWETYSPAWE